MTEAKIVPMIPDTRTAITPMELLKIAADKGADLEKLQQLMSLQERWEANEARKAFIVAVAEFKANPPTIGKNKHVRFQTQKGVTEYDHATLDNVVDAVGPALSKCGLSHRWEMEQLNGGMIRVTCVLTHVQGHAERTSLQSGADESGGKNNIQAISSAVSYLQRYTLLAATGLATGEMDDDGGRVGADFVTEEQANELMALADEVGADKQKFCTYLAVPSFAEIPAAQYTRAKDALEAKRKAKQ